MKTNLTEEEKRAFYEMLKNNGADDKNTPLVFTVTKDSIQIDNADTFKMPEEMVEYRAKGILYANAWISKDKKTWIFKETLGNVDQSFFRFLNGMSDQLEAFSEYEGECKYSLGYYIAEESNITVLTEEPNLHSRMLAFFKDVYETPAEAYYVMFNMITENRRACKTIIKPNGVKFSQTNMGLTYYYMDDKYIVQIDRFILEDFPAINGATIEIDRQIFLGFTGVGYFQPLYFIFLKEKIL